MTFYYIKDSAMEMDMPIKNPSPPHRVDIKHVHDLNERTKKLQCLYGAFRLLVVSDDTPLEKILQEVVDLLPSGWQYPKIACARIIIGDKEYRSERYVHSDTPISKTDNWRSCFHLFMG